MSQSVRTLVFLGVAVVCVGVGFATRSMYTPADLNDFSDVGSEFYPDFADPGSATGLRVASFNEDSGKTDVFSVDVKDDVWRIPSHHEYPADAKDQLAKTAASMVGVERQALIERTKAAHKRYNLLDPLDDKVTGSEGRGDRITLYEGDDLLVDFIVGKQVEGQQNVYHVRAAGEDRFYTADLGDFKISTKFSDWIEKDILDISPKDVKELMIDRYHIDESKGELVQGDQMILERESSTDDWKLNGINSETEELETSNISAMLTALDDLSIVGVRKKPAGISADLKAEEGMSITRSDMRDLQDKGFFPYRGRIVSNEGEVHLGTNAGVLYVLRFGEEFSGSDVDIEVGGDSSEKESDTTKESDDNEADAKSSEDEEDDSLLKSRFLFVTAQFDDALLGEKPTPPVKPQPPAKPEPAAEPEKEKAEKKEDAEKEDPKANEAADAEKKETEKADTDKKEDSDSKEETADEEKLAVPGDEAKPDPQKEYEEALKLYEEELEVYEIKLKDYEKSIEDGQKRVAKLNLRFADWYYVISADVFDRMKLNRVDLVKEKEKPADDGPKPEIKPGDQKAILEALMKQQAAKKAAEKPAPPEGKPAANAKKPAAGEKPAVKKDGTKETVDPKKPEPKPEAPPEVKKPETKPPADPPKSEPKPAEKETPKAEATPDQPKAKEPPPAKSE